MWQLDRYRPWLIALGAAVFIVHAARFVGWTIDDAYIAYRYAANMARGLGPVFNRGEHVEGYTDFAWVVAAAGAIRLGLSPEVVMPTVGLSCGVGLVVLVAREGRLLAEASQARARHGGEIEQQRPVPGAWAAGVPAALIVALCPGMAFYAVSGLETVAFALVSTAAIVLASRGKYRLFAGVAALSFLTRPEGGLVALVGLALGAVRALSGDRSRVRALLEAAAILAAIGLSYAAWKMHFYGALLPNTFAAKAPNWRASPRALASFALPYLGIFALAVMGARERPSARPLLVGWLILETAGAWEAGGDWMPLHRMLLPAYPLAALAADAVILDYLVRPWTPAAGAAASARLPGSIWARFALATTALACVIPAITDGSRQAAHARHMAEEDVFRRELFRTLRTRAVRSAATFDIGLVGYECLDWTLTDLGGLTDRTIARSPGGFFDKRPELGYVEARAPDAFLFTTEKPPRIDWVRGTFTMEGFYPAEDRIKRSRWFLANYSYLTTQKVADTAYLSWFERSR